VVAKFSNQNVCRQTRAGESAVDRQAGSRGLGDALAATAGQFRTHVPGDAERSRHVLQHFGHVFAETPQRAAAFRAGTGGSMFHHVPRQVFRQCLAFRFAPPRLDFRIDRGRVCLRLGFGRGGLRDLFLEIADNQVELIDRTSHLLR